MEKNQSKKQVTLDAISDRENDAISDIGKMIRISSFEYNLF